MAVFCGFLRYFTDICIPCPFRLITEKLHEEDITWNGQNRQTYKILRRCKHNNFFIPFFVDVIIISLENKLVQNITEINFANNRIMIQYTLLCVCVCVGGGGGGDKFKHGDVHTLGLMKDLVQMFVMQKWDQSRQFSPFSAKNSIFAQNKYANRFGMREQHVSQVFQFPE